VKSELGTGASHKDVMRALSSKWQLQQQRQQKEKENGRKAEVDMAVLFSGLTVDTCK
jgi:hypothetical protein